MAAEQRRFAQNKSRLSASEARGTVIDTMRVLRDVSESPEVKTVVEEPTIVDPVDYEVELISKKKVLESEEYKDLLLFPHNDISVSIHTLRRVWQIKVVMCRFLCISVRAVLCFDICMLLLYCR